MSIKYKDVVRVQVTPHPEYQAVHHGVGVVPDHIHVIQHDGDAQGKVGDGVTGPAPTDAVFYLRYAGTVDANFTFLIETWHTITSYPHKAPATTPVLVSYEGILVETDPAAVHVGDPAGGDLGGLYPDPTVEQLKDGLTTLTSDGHPVLTIPTWDD